MACQKKGDVTLKVTISGNIAAQVLTNGIYALVVSFLLCLILFCIVFYLAIRTAIGRC